MSSNFSLVEPKNKNYAASVVALRDFVLLAGCDNIKAAIIFNNSVIVSKDTQVGDLGLFFPAETKLSDEFLGANNLFRKPEWGNLDQEAKGFFEQHGRVKTVKFRGNKSEGFWIPAASLSYTGKNTLTSLRVGDTFDHIGEHEICRKYVPKFNPAKTSSTQIKGRQPKLEDGIVDGQFRFHFDTENLRRNAHKILPTDFISISDKWHGTSVVVGKLLVKRNLRWYERILRKAGVAIQESTYGLTYSSRRVIKAVNGIEKNGEVNHFYSEDIWGVVAKEVEDKIPNGFTLYGEIVGYATDGSAIQKGYSYGCVVGQHKLVVYRVTLTTPDGLTVELTWPQMHEFGSKYGIEVVPEIYYGRAGDLFLVTDVDYEAATWQGAFLKKLEAQYVNDGDCPYNPKGTPAEGIVVRVDRLNECESFKLKNFHFLLAESKLLDKGELDTETAQYEEEPAA